MSGRARIRRDLCVERDTARESAVLAKRAFALLQRRCHVDFDLVPCVCVLVLVFLLFCLCCVVNLVAKAQQKRNKKHTGNTRQKKINVLRNAAICFNFQFLIQCNFLITLPVCA